MADEIISRADARAKGLTRYFTGKPCKHGHVALRKTINGECDDCFDIRIKKFCEDHKDRRNADRRKRHEDNPERKREEKRRHRLANLEEYRERDRLKNERFREAKTAYSLQWQRDNPEKVRAREARRRARKAGSEGNHTKADIDALFAEQGGCCAYCLEPVSKSFHVDHFMPLFKGGSNGPENLRIACRVCNSRKGIRHPIEFMAECLKTISLKLGLSESGKPTLRMTGTMEKATVTFP